MGLSSLTAKAVESAIAEYDNLGQSAFLAKYGFGRAQKYLLVHAGQHYDSKAIAGAAHGHLEGQLGPLSSADFSGGENTVAAKLRELGFEVSSEATPRNPPWHRDELILALDLYAQNPMSPPGKQSTKVRELSDTLNTLAVALGLDREGTFRNSNGVYMKVMNFRRFDPEFAKVGKVGLAHGSKEDQHVWNEFAGDPDRLRDTAEAIRAAVQAGAKAPTITDDSLDILEAPEGRLLAALHQRRERSRKLVEARKRLALREVGELRCEVCDLSFGERYGPHGDGFIEVHHMQPLHTLREGDKTNLTDLALVCSNCHRMIHRQKEWLTTSVLRQMIKG
ncbi:HNH endonuclease [Aminobacter sp. SR38]|jgi:5-methylcytosine-specific restriction protein A|uniref:HNH endonuclease n=1 Tax=Aminobacter sp. SR38 TaxID=2774562 RepID=UPI00178508E7|nr:HNH endonuclease [Aminobacter sp. SR38]QOF73169.1 HNH endonuclease [Aminobacter sp. SR38]